MLAAALLLLAACGTSQPSPSVEPVASVSPSVLSQPSIVPAEEGVPACLDAKLVWADALERLLLVNCFDQLAPDPVETVWAWDADAGWQLLSDSGPIANVVTGMGWDAERDVLVRYGGIPMPEQTCEPSTWEWNTRAWAEAAAAPPPNCDHIELAPDPVTGQLILVGGGEAQDLMPGTWTWDGTAWTQLSDEGPEPRAHHGFSTDADQASTLLYGGLDNTHLFDDLWSWDGTAWTQLSVEGPRPGPRSHHGFAVGASGALLFGGATGTSTFGSLVGDTWLYADGAWTLLDGSNPSARGLPALGYDPTREVFVLHGGFDAEGGALGDTWVWDGAWTCVAGC